MKWLQWMSKVFIVTVFSAIVSIVTTWIIVDLYAEQILKKFNLSDLRKNVQLFDVVGHLTDQAFPDRSSEEHTLSEEDSTSTSIQDRQDLLEDIEDGSEDVRLEDDAVAVWGQAGNQHEIMITAEQFNKIKDELGGEDKLKIFSIISNNLTEELMMQLSVMLEGGLTRGEIKEIEEMMQNLLNEEQIEQIMNIISPFVTR